MTSSGFPGPKLAVECLAGAVAFAFGLKIDLVTNPFGFQLNLAWLSGPATILWLVAVTNAINLADGIDGLAAGIVTFAAMILFFMTFATAHPLVAFIAVALAGAALGFLRYNFSGPPSSWGFPEASCWAFVWEVSLSGLLKKAPSPLPF